MLGRGRRADECNSRARCPQCSKEHGQKDCPLLKGPKPLYIDNSLKKCANCNGNHGAKFSGCPYFKKAREIQDIRYKQKIPMFEAKNVWEERQKARINQTDIINDNQNTRVLFRQNPFLDDETHDSLPSNISANNNLFNLPSYSSPTNHTLANQNYQNNSTNTGSFNTNFPSLIHNHNSVQ